MRLNFLPARFRTAKSQKRPAAPVADEPGASYAFEDLEVGMAATYSRTVTPDDVAEFARLTGDTNPVHLNEDYAAATPFKARIVHGMLTAGYISTVLGTRLPGEGAIYMSQTLKFLAPVYHGDSVTARAEVIELNEAKSRAVMACTCHVGDRLVLQGEAVLKVPRREKQD